jgi:sortase B
MYKWRIGKKAYYQIAILLCLGVIIYCLVSLYSLFISYYGNRIVAEEIRQIYNSGMMEQMEPHGNPSDKPNGSPSDRPNGNPSDRLNGNKSNNLPSNRRGNTRPQFHALLDINADITGWVKIDGTLVDYPILQAEDNDYYLQRNYKREEKRAGSIFMDFRNQLTVDNRNTILYGHDMKDGSMFGSLKRYLQADFFNTYPSISYDTLYESYDAEIFSVYYTTTDVNYIQTDFPDDEAYFSFLLNARERSLYKTDMILTSADLILTLSTCDYTLDAEEGRLVVQAKLVKKRSAS